MTQLAARETAVQALLDAADAHPGVDGAAFSLTLQAVMAAAQVSPDLARPYVSRLWFTPWRIGSGPAVEAREAGWTARMTRTTYEVEGQVLQALEIGEGPTVLLVHGWGDFGARMTALAEPLADRGFRVVAPDLPGHGANLARESSLVEWAPVVRELAWTVDARAIVAHSLGGVAAARAATEVALDALVLLAPAVRLAHVVDTFQAMFGLPEAATDGLRTDIEEKFGHQVWDEWQVDRFAVPAVTPVLLLHSDDDEQIDVADGRLLAEALPAFEYVELTGLGHTKLVRDEGVVARVAEFLSEHVSTRAV
jgi:pimeloyl-ACP methyl ester carboxylesterase